MKKDFLVLPNPTQRLVEKKNTFVVAYVTSNFLHAPDWQNRDKKQLFGGLVYFSN